jgi:hypothetical protein
MRYKIRASSPEVYENILPLVRHEATVRVESDRRLTIAAEDVLPELCERLKDMGAVVVEDFQYVPESAA